MTVPAFLVTGDKSHRLILGLFHLLSGLLLIPFLAALLLRVVRRMNELVLRPLAPWQETGFTAGRYFFAFVSFAVALHGAALLSIAALARSGLIRNPWE